MTRLTRRKRILKVRMVIMTELNPEFIVKGVTLQNKRVGKINI